MVRLFLVEKFEKGYIDDKRTELLRFGNMLAVNYRLMHKNNEPEEVISFFFTDIAERENIRITIITTEGDVTFDSKKDESVMENHGSRPEVRSALYGTSDSSLRFSNELKLYMLYVAIPLKINNEVIGVIRTSYPLAKIKERKNDFILEMLKIGFSFPYLRGGCRLLSFP